MINIARALVAVIGQIGLLAAVSATAAPPPEHPPLPGAYDLNDLITPRPGLVLEAAMSIDDEGRILVWASRGMADGPLLLVPATKPVVPF